MNNVSLNFAIFEQAIKDLSNRCEELNSTYLETQKCFNRLRNAEMQGETAKVLLDIYDEWEKINKNKLEKLNNLYHLLRQSYNEYDKYNTSINEVINRE